MPGPTWLYLVTADPRPNPPQTPAEPGPMRLNTYLRPDLVVTGFHAQDTDTALQGIARHLAGAGMGPTEDVALAGLRDREAIHTTVLGKGLALPHATLEGLDDPVILLALADEPVEFGPEGTEPVRVFFALLSPPNRQGEHIKILARICRLVRHENFAEGLRDAADADAVLSYIRSVDEQHV